MEKMNTEGLPDTLLDLMVDSHPDNWKWIHVGYDHWYLFAGYECVWIQNEPPFGYEDEGWNRGRVKWKEHMYENGTATSHGMEKIVGEPCIHGGDVF